MRLACVECGLTVGHYESCPLDPPPPERPDRRGVLILDAIVQSNHHQTWTA